MVKQTDNQNNLTANTPNKEKQMKVKGLIAACAMTAAALTTSPAQANRDYISIVGSSTVYPFRHRCG